MFRFLHFSRLYVIEGLSSHPVLCGLLKIRRGIGLQILRIYFPWRTQEWCSRVMVCIIGAGFLRKPNWHGNWGFPGGGIKTLVRIGFHLSFFTILSLKAFAQSGIISTVAGNTVAAYAGDGKAATLASLASSSAVALDSSGNLYIADTNNCVIRKIDADTHKISTVAGTGETCGCCGDNNPATADRQYRRS